jgi:hypothetical protein
MENLFFWKINQATEHKPNFFQSLAAKAATTQQLMVAILDKSPFIIQTEILRMK